MAVEVEVECAIGREERRDSRRRHCDGGTKRSLAWRKDRVTAAAEEIRRTSVSFRRSLSDIFVGFLSDFRFLELTTVVSNAGLPLAADLSMTADFPAPAAIALPTSDRDPVQFNQWPRLWNPTNFRENCLFQSEILFMVPFYTRIFIFS